MARGYFLGLVKGYLFVRVWFVEVICFLLLCCLSVYLYFFGGFLV